MATYALIPGGGGDPWEWHRLVSELASRGQEATAVRLPADDDAASWSEYADAVVHAISDHADVILVAASMGGFTAPIVCTRRRVDLLVLLNAMIPMPGRPSTRGGRTRALDRPGPSTTPASGCRPARPRITPSSTTTTCRPISEPRRSHGRGRTSR